MNILDNKFFHKILDENLLSLNNFESVIQSKENKDINFSYLNGSYDYFQLMNVSKGITGWLMERDNSSVFLKISTLSNFNYESKYVLFRKLYFWNGYDNVHFDEECLYRNVYSLSVDDYMQKGEGFCKSLVFEIIAFVLAQEEHISLLALYGSEYRLLNIDDGLISFTTNNYMSRFILDEMSSGNFSAFSEWVWDM